MRGMDVSEARRLAEELPFFSGWSRPDLNRFFSSCDVVEKPFGEVVLSAGSEVDGLYLILSGRVAVTIPTVRRAGDRPAAGGAAEERLLGYLHRGEPIGEVALLSGEASMATVRTVSDCVLLRLPRAHFEKLAREIPSFLFALSRITTSRLRRVHAVASTPMPGRITSVYAAEPKAGRSLFAFNLAASLAQETGRDTLLLELTLEGRSFWRFLRPGAPPKLVSLREVETRRHAGKLIGVRHEAGFDFLSIAHEEGNVEAARAVSPLLSALSVRYHFIVLDLPAGMNEVVYRFLAQSDRVFLLSSTDPLALDRTRALVEKLPSAERSRVVVTPLPREARDKLAACEARLGHPVYCSLPETPRLEEETEEKGMPHVLLHPRGHYARTIRHIARELGEVLVGLVLGAGAARGLSHIGVLQVLEEEDITVDLVAGASIGALVGGAWATGLSAERILGIARRFAAGGKFFRLTDLAFPPSPALLRPTRTENLLRRIFGEKTFADTLLPLKIVATDLETSEEVLLESGPIWKAVRASISIPGIFPPYVHEGRPLVDGAIIDPVPVSVMKRLGVRKIVAVNCIPSSEVMQRLARRGGGRREPPGFLRRAFRAVAGRLFDLGRGEMPGIIDIIVQSHQYLEAEIAEAACREASVVIRPWVQELEWLDFDRPDPFVEAGRTAARKALPELRELVGRT